MDKKSILKENEISAKQTLNLLKNDKKNISFLDIRERKDSSGFFTSSWG